MKNVFKMIVAGVLLIAGVLSITSCTAWDKTKEKADEVWGDMKDGFHDVTGISAVDPIDLSFTDGMNISLCSADVPETVPATVSKMITATVLPSEAPDKTTIWDVYWINNATGNPDAVVTDYIDIMPCTADGTTRQDGSNYCLLTCKQSFRESEIGVRVNTVVGGYSAECLVTYVGVPTAMQLQPAGNLDAGVYKIAAGSTYRLPVSFINPFDDVADSEHHYEIVLTGSGSFYAHKNWSDANKTDEEVLINPADYISNFATAEIDGDCIVLSGLKSFTSFAYFSRVFDLSYSRANDACLTVTVTDTVTNLSATYNFIVEPVITSVSVDSSITF